MELEYMGGLMEGFAQRQADRERQQNLEALYAAPLTEAERAALDCATQLHPIVTAPAADCYICGDAQGRITGSLGPFWPEPTFTVEEISRGRREWQYVVPQSTPLELIEGPLSPWARPQLREARLAHWGVNTGAWFYHWYIGFAPELSHFVYWGGDRTPRSPFQRSNPPRSR